MTVDLSKIKKYQTDPYKENQKYQLRSQTTKDGYTVLTYRKSHGLGWKVGHGAVAFFSTVGSCFIGLASSWVRGEWEKAWTGKTVKQIKVPIIDSVPTQADFAYRGSNAEYLLLNSDGQPCPLSAFQEKAIPAINQRFPRPQGVAVSDELLDNESAIIQSQLTDAGMTAVKIPKSLYDLFYLRFHLQDRLEGKAKVEDYEQINAMAQKKFEEGKVKDPIYVTEKHKYSVYAYNPGGELSVHVPMIDFDLWTKKENPDRSHVAVVNRRYVKQETHKNYPKVLHQLNQRALEYIAGLGIDPQNLDWANMRRITEALLADIQPLYENNAIYNKPQFDDGGKVVDFARHFVRNKERIYDFILRAIWHEYQAPPGVYTIYRGADVDKDDLVASHSLSFGHSVLGGLQYDGRSGSPVSFAYRESDLIAVDINIKDYENKGEAFQHVHIPPARGPNRVTEWGEVGHVRSKVKYNGEEDPSFGGFTGGGFLGVKQKDLDVLVSQVATPEEVQEHNKASRVFFKAMRTIILPKTS